MLLFLPRSLVLKVILLGSAKIDASYFGMTSSGFFNEAEN
jgi:hypothetical protein